ncbi:hypothetical protein HJC23_000534 [Cyclotella cryptica]|uniref:Radical SAM core domain-containing protein n=1 Tax=Cyclotella cryptica TaxID=29204 RepID=A0ABD3NPW3_9STRA|eukprot:CCRYP_020862-RA/>CCRYP_020862-RA protein AED:0.02 eAED:0.02 QI:328/1/0.66/1/1/1/3/2040/561
MASSTQKKSASFAFSSLAWICSLTSTSCNAAYSSLPPSHRTATKPAHLEGTLLSSPRRSGAFSKLSSSTLPDIPKLITPEEESGKGLLSFTLEELSDKLGGYGRSTAVWDCIRRGIDPNLYYSKTHAIGDGDSSDRAVLNSWLDACVGDTSTHETSVSDDRNPLEFDKGQGLGQNAWDKLQSIMEKYHSCDETQRSRKKSARKEILCIENSIASLSHMKVSSDGTIKLLLKMVKDGLEVESVIIPWKEKGFSTLCVSSQVGCKQGCSFCATGREYEFLCIQCAFGKVPTKNANCFAIHSGMGKLRSLTADEITVQVYYASKVCRVINSKNTEQSDNMALPTIDNIVFMGMGEPADNALAVVSAANALADRRMFSLAQSKITISTVAPDESAFETLGKAPALLAWSVHAVKDSLRRQLVPTTKSLMEELRHGLVKALSNRSISMRRTMLEVVLISGVNDSDEDAELLSEFAQSIMRDVKGAKVIVNLIPFNDIGHPTHRTPSMERVLDFQRIVIQHGNESGTDKGLNPNVLCYVRTTRGDDESSACGQLATKRRPPIGKTGM